MKWRRLALLEARSQIMIFVRLRSSRSLCAVVRRQLERNWWLSIFKINHMSQVWGSLSWYNRTAVSAPVMHTRIKLTSPRGMSEPFSAFQIWAHVSNKFHGTAPLPSLLFRSREKFHSWHTSKQRWCEAARLLLSRCRQLCSVVAIVQSGFPGYPWTQHQHWTSRREFKIADY